MKGIKFAENLKNLRISRGLTQKELAKLLAVDQRTISAWEKKICEPDFNTLAKISEIFKEDFNDLLT
ncbi:MAG: helix-turn-helix transcriptional regulator [Clostridia bacterium]|nr:helix-turn-helix transcriptional regulator [Clostridia bacterium]